ncbi:hypothetical protein HDV57DRAFT_113906 [Trichoderma longibrachiatum]
MAPGARGTTKRLRYEGNPQGFRWTAKDVAGMDAGVMQTSPPASQCGPGCMWMLDVAHAFKLSVTAAPATGCHGVPKRRMKRSELRLKSANLPRPCLPGRASVALLFAARRCFLPTKASRAFRARPRTLMTTPPRKEPCATLTTSIREMMQGGDGPTYENRTSLSTSWNYDYYIARSTPCATWEVAVLGRCSIPAATVSSALQTLNDMPPFASSNVVVLVRRTRPKAPFSFQWQELITHGACTMFQQILKSSRVGLSLALFLGQSNV